MEHIPLLEKSHLYSSVFVPYPGQKCVLQPSSQLNDLSGSSSFLMCAVRGLALSSCLRIETAAVVHTSEKPPDSMCSSVLHAASVTNGSNNCAILHLRVLC